MLASHEPEYPAISEAISEAISGGNLGHPRLRQKTGCPVLLRAEATEFDRVEGEVGLLIQRRAGGMLGIAALSPTYRAIALTPSCVNTRRDPGSARFHEEPFLQGVRLFYTLHHPLRPHQPARIKPQCGSAE